MTTTVMISLFVSNSLDFVIICVFVVMYLLSRVFILSMIVLLDAREM